MQVQAHKLNELHCHRYPSDEAIYALVISHGLGGHGGIYDRFCSTMSRKEPTSGPTTKRPRGTWTMQEWAQASRVGDMCVHGGYTCFGGVPYSGGV